MVNIFDPSDSIHAFFKINRLSDDDLSNTRGAKKLDCVVDSRRLSKNSNSRISTLSCSDKFLVSGTFEGDYVLTDISDSLSPKHIGEYSLTKNYDGITNSIIINDDAEIIASSNDKYIRFVDLPTGNKNEVQLPFAGNSLAQNKFNPNELFVSGDSLDSFIFDRRIPFTSMDNLLKFKGQEDFSFSCDWSPANEHLLLSGNQDGNVRLWDRRRNEEPIHCWGGNLGSSHGSYNLTSGPVRNSKFSQKGDFICWAESLDHVGLINTKDLHEESSMIDRVQSIDFIGKCIGISFRETENGYGEQLVIGVNDCPLGGILSYNLESDQKCLDFDFYF